MEVLLIRTNSPEQLADLETFLALLPSLSHKQKLRLGLFLLAGAFNLIQTRPRESDSAQ